MPYTAADVDAIRNAILPLVPFGNVTLSTLGGVDKASIMMVFSFDAKAAWANGILENSRYARFSMHSNGRIENFGGYGCNKFRAGKLKSVQHAIDRLTEWVKGHAK